MEVCRDICSYVIISCEVRHFVVAAAWTVGARGCTCVRMHEAAEEHGDEVDRCRTASFPLPVINSVRIEGRGHAAAFEAGCQVCVSPPASDSRAKKGMEPPRASPAARLFL